MRKNLKLLSLFMLFSILLGCSNIEQQTESILEVGIDEIRDA